MGLFDYLFDTEHTTATTEALQAMVGDACASIGELRDTVRELSAPVQVRVQMWCRDCAANP